MPRLESLRGASYNIRASKRIFEAPRGYRRGEFFSGSVFTLRLGLRSWRFAFFTNGVLRTVHLRPHRQLWGYSATLDRSWSIIEADREARVEWLEDCIERVFAMDTLTAAIIANEIADILPAKR